MSEALRIADHEARKHHVSDYITDLAERYGQLPVYFINWDCSEGIATSQMIVQSPMELEGSVIRVDAHVQHWELGVSCDHDEFNRLSTGIDIEKNLHEDGTGTAHLFGEITYGKKSETCDVDFIVEFDAVTGEPTEGSGEICGKDVAEYLDRLVVPGLQDEHLLQGD